MEGVQTIFNKTIEEIAEMPALAFLVELNKAQEAYNKANEKYRSKKDSLYLDTDWDTLKKEKGISNDKKRDAHVNKCAAKFREDRDRAYELFQHYERIYRLIISGRGDRTTIINSPMGTGYGQLPPKQVVWEGEGYD